MNKPSPNNSAPKQERRFDTELLKKGLRCDLDQYDMLKRCSDKKDMTEWNQWRVNNPEAKILLQGALLDKSYLRKVDFRGAELSDSILTGAYLSFANLENAILYRADLRNSKLFAANLKKAQLGKDSKFVEVTFSELKGEFLLASDVKGLKLGATLRKAILRCAKLEGCEFSGTDVRGADFRRATVDSATVMQNCKLDRNTDFRGVALGNCWIEPGHKQLLECNIRRMNWEDWYKEHKILHRPVWLFWSFSDYGKSTWRIIAWFFGLAFAFAIVYSLFPRCVKVYGNVGDVRGFWHALYFSIVTMTTLGFGDIAANPDSWLGQTLLMVQVILGYVLLGALITRFAVLFTAGGPAGKFADEKTIGQRLKEWWNKNKKKR
jgi:uncharacterized protein YjbI with pentapeptide repeats